MAQGRPPRHSKSGREPVTLDLKAEKSPKPEAETPPQDEGPVESANEETDGDAAAAPEDGRPGSEVEPRSADASAVVAAEDPAVAGENQAAEERSAAAESEGGEEAPTEAAAEPVQGSDAGEISPSGPENPSSVLPPEGSSGSGRGFVAGLLGGVIIAAIAFGLQYGGVLPVPGRNVEAAQQTQASLSGLQKDVTGLKQNVAALQNVPPPQPDNTQALDDLKKNVAALSDRLGNLEKQASQTSANTVSKAAVGGLNDDVKTLQGTVQETSSRLDALAKRVDALASKVSQAGSEAALVKAIAATALSSAIDRGGSFKAELQAYRGVAPDDPVGAELQKLSASGVPSHAQLLQEFPDTADAILAAVNGSSDNSGIFDRLMSSAQSVIKVRPTGAVKGSSPKAVVARMDVKLKEGDLNGVVKEWSNLPEAGRNAAKAFIADVKTRLKAESLASKAMKASMPNAGAGKEQG